VRFFANIREIEADLERRDATPYAQAVASILSRMTDNKHILAEDGNYLLSSASSELNDDELNALCAVSWGDWLSSIEMP
jgi:hypothetical protein